MKKSIFFSIFVVLIVLAGLILTGCEATEIGEGTINEGTIRLINNSTNVIIVYWSAEQRGDIIVENHTRIDPGSSVAVSIRSGYFYTIYLEDNYGDGWETKNSVFINRDRTVEIRFPSDFTVSN